jgi:hypothetical protein
MSRLAPLWSVEHAEALAFLRSRPTASAGLVFFSPPYEDARTYGAIKFKLRGEAWVKWMRPIVVEAARVSKGLVIVNAAGKVRKHRYSPIMEFLTADLVRIDGLVMGPSPYAWTKASGIPGSGNKRSGYHRRSWEPLYAYCLPDRLPLFWHDHLAFGKKPKWGPGGEMANRMTSGKRVNQWGAARGSQESGGHMCKNGKRQGRARPGHVFQPVGRNEWGMKGGSETRGQNGKKRPRLGRGSPKEQPAFRMRVTAGTGKDGDMLPNRETAFPAIANPGNVILTNVGGGHLGHKAAHKSVAPMPVALAERFVCWFCPPGEEVLDPFAGSCTTGDAARRHNRTFRGCDLDPDMVEVGRARLAALTPGMY